MTSREVHGTKSDEQDQGPARKGGAFDAFGVFIPCWFLHGVMHSVGTYACEHAPLNMRTEGTRDSQGEVSTVSTTVKTTVDQKVRAFGDVKNSYP